MNKEEHIEELTTTLLRKLSDEFWDATVWVDSTPVFGNLDGADRRRIAKRFVEFAIQMVNDELTNALHPEFGFIWQEGDIVDTAVKNAELQWRAANQDKTREGAIEELSEEEYPTMTYGETLAVARREVAHDIEHLQAKIERLTAERDEARGERDRLRADVEALTERLAWRVASIRTETGDYEDGREYEAAANELRALLARHRKNS